MAEISKRDIWSPERVAQERPDVNYRLVAIDFLTVEVGTFKVSIFELHGSDWRAVMLVYCLGMYSAK